MKPSAPHGPGRSSEEEEPEPEPDAAEAGLDFRAGMAVKERYAEMYYINISAYSDIQNQVVSSLKLSDEASVGCCVYNQLIFSILLNFQFRVFTWGRQVTMEENAAT